MSRQIEDEITSSRKCASGGIAGNAEAVVTHSNANVFEECIVNDNWIVRSTTVT